MPLVKEKEKEEEKNKRNSNMDTEGSQAKNEILRREEDPANQKETQSECGKYAQNCTLAY